MALSGLLSSSAGLLCLIALVSSQYTPPTAPGCEDNAVQSGNIHLAHEIYAELFYKCDSGLNRFTQACGPGTVYDSSLGVCVPPNRATVQYWTCEGGSNTYPALCNNEYFRCSASGFERVSCPSGQRFNMASGQCSTSAQTLDHALCSRPGTGEASDYVCYDLEDLEGNPCEYRTLFSTIDIRNRPCPAGTAFNKTACQCNTLSNECPNPSVETLALLKAFDAQCRPSMSLNFQRLPLVATSTKMSNSTLPFQFQTVGVNILSDQAAFNVDPVTGNNARIYFYYMALNQLAANFAINVILRLDPVNSNSNAVQTSAITLIQNNYNGVCTPTLSVTLQYANGRFTLNIEAVGSTQTGVSTATTISGTTQGTIQMSSQNYIQVVILFDGTISAQMADRGPSGTSNPTNVVTVAATSTLGSSIATSQCGLSIGEGLVGRIRTFSIHEGCGDLNRARIQA